jgi:mRNA deadenylase 3'-5' endonuclease subunit Ccr4
MYEPNTNTNHDMNKISKWEYRAQLLKDKIQTINPDIVCMQEVSPLSFDSDFEFMMNELGYDGVEMFRRGRFRPATFWKSDKCKLVSDPVHKDRTLLTAFQLNGLDEDHPSHGRNYHVLNCHLQAGPEGRRRVRQIDEGVKASFKLAKKLKGELQSTSTSIKVQCSAVMEVHLIIKIFLENRKGGFIIYLHYICYTCYFCYHCLILFSSI